MGPKERVPPGQDVTGLFPVLHAGSIPAFDEKTWAFRVYGAVENPIRFSYAEFMRLAKKEVLCDIHCVTSWSKLDTKWGGVGFKTLMEMARPTAKAKYVVMECEQGFTTNLPFSDMDRDDVLIAYEYDGKKLTGEHGFPLRTLVPHKYFWKSAKWVRALRLQEEDEPGFWEVRGYSNSADPWKEERYW
ncbi:MAG: sulfite oxidase-like oxidoreductase [Euryarchaeota archaeon]|nr:sulfite oxidase-like oxidoreductase [Euryarchaeota archaeon]